jgi:hypothetical protein
MIRLLIPLFTLGLFCVLASYCYPRYTSQHPVSEGEFVAQKLVEYELRDAGVAHPVANRTVFIWRDKSAAALADALSLTVSSIDETVDVRRQS